jgi:hypothetical protein
MPGLEPARDRLQFPGAAPVLLEPGVGPEQGLGTVAGWRRDARNVPLNQGPPVYCLIIVFNIDEYILNV